MPDNLEESIRDNAAGPAEAHGDSGGMKQHSLKDQIEVDRYLASKRAMRKKRRGVRLSQITPPGAQ
ncbi:hypothetical protein [Thalassoglobus sp.]|uniref:hypothetical protein n=1 Tax=Thalassoglobus sp. TaxID=2795869 RepID=UPI003AA9DF67